MLTHVLPPDSDTCSFCGQSVPGRESLKLCDVRQKEFDKHFLGSIMTAIRADPDTTGSTETDYKELEDEIRKGLDL